MALRSDLTNKPSAWPNATIWRNIIKIPVAFGAILFSQNGFAEKASQTMFYTVKQGDNLAAVLRSLNLRPLYTAKGSLSQLFQCNEKFKNVNAIEPGTVLRLEFNIDSQVKKYVRVLESGEIIIDNSWLKAQSDSKKSAALVSTLAQSKGTPFRFLCKTHTPKTLLAASQDAAPHAPPAPKNTKPIEKLALREPSRQTSPTPAQAKPIINSVNYSKQIDTKNMVIEQVVQDTPREMPLALNMEATPAQNTEEWPHRSEIGLHGTGQFTKIDERSTYGGYALLLSNLNSGINMHWREDISQRWDLELKFQYSKQQYVPPIGQEVVGNSTAAQFGANTYWNFLNNSKPNSTQIRAGLGAHYGTHPLIIYIGNTTTHLNSPQVFSISAQLENDLPIGSKRKGMFLRTQALGWYGPTSKQNTYTLKNGFGYTLSSTLLRPAYGPFYVSGGLSSSVNMYNTSLGQHGTVNIQALLGVGYFAPEN